MCLTPARAAACQISWLSAALRPSGFSHSTCLPACAAAIVGSPCRLFGPELSNSATRSSASSSRQSVTAVSKPYRCAASATAVRLRPAIAINRGRSGGGQVMYGSVLYAFECALPMNA